ncbi:MAG: DUF3343 domain-containing protein [Clostridia bacterium]|nr:DUF3343 domain-containing protein [Clostridia bacterium]
MTDCIIAMRSQTYAAKGKRVLGKAGIRAVIVSIDPSLTKNGCAYGLRISGESCPAAADILGDHHILHGDIIGKGGYYL